MRLARTKVIAAMAALEKFTAADLSDMSGVGEPTVRTVLGREPHLASVISSERTGRPGGQRKIYALQPGMRDQIVTELRHLDSIARQVEERSGFDLEIPDALLIAEDMLLRSVVGETDPDRRETLLRRADGQIAAAAALGLEATPNSMAAGRLSAVRWLHRLSGEESIKAESGAAETVDFLLTEFSRIVWPQLLSYLADEDESGLLSAYVSRAMTSPLFQGQEIWKIFPPATPGYVIVVDDDVHEEHRGGRTVTSSLTDFLEFAGVSYDVVPSDTTKTYEIETSGLVVFTVDCGASALSPTTPDIHKAGLSAVFQRIQTQSERLLKGNPFLTAAVVSDCTTAEVMSWAYDHDTAYVALHPKSTGPSIGDRLFQSKVALASWSAPASRRATSTGGHVDLLIY